MGGALGGSGGGEEAAKDMQRALEQAQNMMKQYYGQAVGYMQPFYNQGIDAMGKYSGRLNEMSDPQAFYQKMMSGYNLSPQAQFQQQQAQKASNQAAAASGMLGGGAQQKALADYTQQLTSRDQQQWLNNMLGINTQYLGGEQGLMGQGYGAGGMMGGWGMDTGKGLSDLMSQIGQAQAYGDIAKGSNNLFGNLLGGVLGGGLNLLTGGMGGGGGLFGSIGGLFGGGGGGGGGGMSWQDLQRYLPESDFRI